MKPKSDLPCLITPDIMSFHAQERETNILTIYNHHEFAIQYKIKSTSPKMFHVGSSSGTIRPQASLEITIDLQKNASDLVPQGSTSRDKFMVEVSADGSTTQKIIKVTVEFPLQSPPLPDFLKPENLLKVVATVRKLMPIILGALLVYFITFSPSDVLSTAKLWGVFILGLAVMFATIKRQP
eukprot:TRINITY_DN4757_c0_g1_i1.p1 TRINITY_DN4757_c0_g1~~TRINITY_DN4757_c0_g1_i1.p1  ORF type:complete len:182 (+),score=21.00 TRINITY_DN4757_c0_g1_i1:265-810(+)